MSHMHIRTWATVKSDYICLELTILIKYILDQSYSDIYFLYINIIVVTHN